MVATSLSLDGRNSLFDTRVAYKKGKHAFLYH